MNWAYLGIIIFLILFSLIIYGLISKPSLKRMVIAAGSGHFNQQCVTSKVACNTDQDCKEKCVESSQGEEMVCQAIPPTSSLTDRQMSVLNTNTSGVNKFCVPAAAIPSLKKCNIAHGGIPIFSGWSGMVNSMEFECMCAYPEWANSRVCDSDTGSCSGVCLINPDICAGGTFNWDLTKKVETPIAELCECAKGDVMIVNNDGLPRCVPGNIQSFYDDLDISTGARGGQSIKNVDSVPITSLNTGQLCQSCQCCIGKNNCDCNTCENMYTVCPSGCCMLPNAVCCSGSDGENYCCPEGYECDVENGRCVRKCCLEESGNCTGGCCDNETTCSQGCCPLKDGVCCSDGASCCPANFPHCDTINKVCNPDITPLVKGNCNVGSDNTQCPSGCCPFSDGVCCGDYCCPPEYPICDVENGMCKMYN